MDGDAGVGGGRLKGWDAPAYHWILESCCKAKDLHLPLLNISLSLSLSLSLTHTNTRTHSLPLKCFETKVELRRVVG